MQDDLTLPAHGLAGPSGDADGKRVTWSVQEVAERLGIPAATVYTYIQSG